MRYAAQDDYEQYISEFITNFSQDEEYVAYGAGNAFCALRELFGDKLKIKFCIDMDSSKKVPGVDVFPPEYLQEKRCREKIIITTNGGYADEIACRLESMGYDRTQYCHGLELISVWSWYYQKKVASLFCALVLGFACNLDCKGCSEYVGYHKSKEMLDFATLRQTIDDYFTTVDYCIQINVLGGETFISGDVGKICRYIHEQYGGHFHKMVIHTNGTIVPRPEILEDLSRCEKLHIWISDYSGQINETQKKNIERFMESLRLYQIKHNAYDTFNQKENAEQWFDLGDPRVKKGEEPQVLRHRFSKCSGICFSLYRNRYYYCVMQLSAAETGLYDGSLPGDYIDLSAQHGLSREESAENFLKFQLGFVENGYVSFCDNCNGLGIEVNKKFIEAGSQ